MELLCWVYIVLGFLELHAKLKMDYVKYEHVASGITILKLDFCVNDYDVYRTQINAYFSLLERLKYLFSSARVFGTK